jgi:hypothetical protein
MVFGILLHTVVAGYLIFATSATKINSLQHRKMKQQSFHRKLFPFLGLPASSPTTYKAASINYKHPTLTMITVIH